ncbi:hypothetical protein B296_00054966, partial [Ensete ventricosum]
MGGTYWSVSLLVRGPPTIGRYAKNRPSAVDFGHRRSIEGDRRKREEEEEEEKKQNFYRLRSQVARAPLPTHCRSHIVAAHTRWRLFSRARRKIEPLPVVAHGLPAS